MKEEEKSINSLDSDLKNYKSLFEEIAQNDSEIYLTKSFQDAIRFGISDDDSGTNSTRCCCCKVHRKQNATPTSASFIPGGAVTNTKSFNVPNIYNTIWMGEMKNATDYIEYLNETRRNSFNSLNKDNRSNYYNLMRGDYHSLTTTTTDGDGMSVRDSGISGCEGKNFLQVPKHNLPHDHMRRTPEFEDISKKIDQLQELDSNVSSLIYKSIEVHADILSLDATVSRLLAETRKLLEELEDVKCLDDIIDMLNSECIFKPIIHHEWISTYPLPNTNIPIDEGVVVSSAQ